MVNEVHTAYNVIKKIYYSNSHVYVSHLKMRSLIHVRSLILQDIKLPIFQLCMFIFANQYSMCAKSSNSI